MTLVLVDLGGNVDGWFEDYQEAKLVHVFVKGFVFAHVADEHIGFGDTVFVGQILTEFAPVELPAHALCAEVEILAIYERIGVGLGALVVA